MGTNRCCFRHSMDNVAAASRACLRSSIAPPVVEAAESVRRETLRRLDAPVAVTTTYLLESEGIQGEVGIPKVVSRSSKTPVSVLMRVSVAMVALSSFYRRQVRPVPGARAQSRDIRYLPQIDVMFPDD